MDRRSGRGRPARPAEGDGERCSLWAFIMLLVQLVHILILEVFILNSYMRFHIEMSTLWKLPWVHFIFTVKWLFVSLRCYDLTEDSYFRPETIDADEELWWCLEASAHWRSNWWWSLSIVSSGKILRMFIPRFPVYWTLLRYLACWTGWRLARFLKYEYWMFSVLFWNRPCC